MRRLKKIFIFVLFSFIFLANVGLCDEEPVNKKRFSGIEFLSGSGFGKLKYKGNYLMVPFFVGFNYDVKSLSERMHLPLPGMVQFILEPFGTYVYHPEHNAEIGTNFLLKIGLLPETAKLQPYLKGGTGIVYLTQHSKEQAMQFDFNEYIGFGFHYFYQKNTAFTVEYRYRHVSNADFANPNFVIRTNFILCGLSYRF